MSVHWRHFLYALKLKSFVLGCKMTPKNYYVRMWVLVLLMANLCRMPQNEYTCECSRPRGRFALFVSEQSRLILTTHKCCYFSGKNSSFFPYAYGRTATSWYEMIVTCTEQLKMFENFWVGSLPASPPDCGPGVRVCFPLKGKRKIIAACSCVCSISNWKCKCPDCRFDTTLKTLWTTGWWCAFSSATTFSRTCPRLRFVKVPSTSSCDYTKILLFKQEYAFFYSTPAFHFS